MQEQHLKQELTRLKEKLDTTTDAREKTDLQHQINRLSDMLVLEEMRSIYFGGTHGSK